ncbi:T9SS type A sorting domain-containing protein [Candidatus Zixiibacteriota bacterium]
MNIGFPQTSTIHTALTRRSGKITAAAFFLLMISVVYLFLYAADAFAEWRIDIESKTVDAGETGVTLAITAYWDTAMAGLSIPLVVREIDSGAFWTGALPFDTLGTASFHPYAQGVNWNWDSPWADLIEEILPSSGIDPENLCDPSEEGQYDGISPDHFAINIAGPLPGAPPEPLGRTIVTLTFDIADQAGRFEFDTACFSMTIQTIHLVDTLLPAVDHGPGGTGELTFNKGVITVIAPGGILETDNAIPGKWALFQNRPNPFNNNTLIDFFLSGPGRARLEVFDILGQKVVDLIDEFLPVGTHQASWNGKNDRGKEVGSGIYFYRLTAGDRTETKKMVLLK